MIEIKAPNPVDCMNKSVFLAGSIEMGRATLWQDVVVKSLSKENIQVLNPRRDEWDNSWIQSIDNPQFNEQVTWELEGIEQSDVLFFYFQPNTKSPITLMELGYALGANYHDESSLVVCCPDGFWRKGNVDILCSRNRIEVYEDFNVALYCLSKLIKPQ